jgi:hypothetical protein
MRLAEFNFKFLMEAMANFGEQMKLLVDNKPVENPDEDEQKLVEKKAKSFKAATEKKEKLNDFFY